MKKKILAAFGLGLFVIGLNMSQAEGAVNQQNAYDQAVQKACDSAQDLGYNIMILRQTPITEAEQIQAVKDVGLMKRTEEIGIKMVVEAHKRPLADPQDVQSVSQTFGDDMQAKCLKDMSGTIL